MAGIGIELNKIFRKHTLWNTVKGIGFSTIITIAPMLVIIGNMLLLFRVLDYDSLRFYDRELLSCTILYVFIFSVLTVAPFNSVISRYIADKIFEEKREDILPCFYTGLMMTVGFGVVLAVPFYLHEIFTGGVSPVFVFTSFCMFASLVIIFYTMIYLSVTKDYKLISLFFFLGMVLTFVLAVVLALVFGMNKIYAIQYGFAAGFFLTAFLEFSYVKRYFHTNSGNYRGVLPYFRTYWKLVVTNFFYTLGLYIHNFVFWTTDLSMTVVKTYICNQPYDMATCLAMFTCISASVIFIVQIETKFHERYQKYSESVIGGKLKDIDKAKNRMFRCASDQLLTLVHFQFIISVIIFLVFYIFLPRFGMSGLVMDIYPCLAAAYFIIFTLYSLILFLYYFDDLTGAMLTALVFFAATLAGSLGRYRSGLSVVYELKTREYMARGIPFIYATDDFVIEKFGRFCLRVPNDDTPVDMDAVLSFMRDMRAHPEAPAQMRDFAAREMTFDVQFSKIISALFGSESSK